MKTASPTTYVRSIEYGCIELGWLHLHWVRKASVPHSNNSRLGKPGYEGLDSLGGRSEAESFHVNYKTKK